MSHSRSPYICTFKSVFCTFKSVFLVNIKERLDFSCALFDGEGGLVANAPHVPVHLGAMADTVQAQVAKLEGTLRDGDVIVANR